MKLNLQSLNAQEMAVNQELDIDESKVEDIFQMLDSDEFPSNFQPIFIYQEEYFALLIKAIEIDDEIKVSRILHLSNKESINIAQTFNHGILGYIDNLYGNNKHFSKTTFSRKTLLIVAVQSNAHQSLKLLVEHAQQYMSEVNRKAFFSWTVHFSSEGELSALDILLYDGVLTRKKSEFEDLKPSIALFMSCGIKNNAWPILYYPVYNLNLDLIKLMVEEHNADVNEWYVKGYESALCDVMGGEDGEGFFDYNDEGQEKIKNIIAYLLERGAIIQPWDGYAFLASLHRSGSEELYNIVEPYKDQIEFNTIFPLNTLDPFLESLNVQRSFLLEIRLLDRPVFPDSYDIYQKLLIMQGNSIDFTFAKTKFNIPETIFRFNELEMHNMIAHVANQEYYSPRSKYFLISQQKVFILNVRRFNLMIPRQSNDLFFKLVLQAGSDDDLDHILNTLNIVPSVQWLQNNNPFNLCERVKQALLLKTKFEKLDLMRHIEHLPAFQSVQRYCTFFARTANIPARGSARCGINMTALGAFKDCLLDSELLSLRETINFMQVSKAYYGDIETPTADTSLIPTL